MMRTLVEGGNTYIDRLTDLVEDGARRVAHLVELVDAADAVVGEDERACLKYHLLRFGVFGDVGGQTDGAGPLARGVLRPVREGE